MTLKKLLSREEVLGGMGGRTAKQASALLNVIENRAAYLQAESCQAASPTPLISKSARSQSYLSALAQGRERNNQPTIYELERYAPGWAELVPENSAVRAGVAHLLGQKYRFTKDVTPALNAALGLHTPAVEAAYQKQYTEPLSSIHVERLDFSERWRWFWANLASWLENLSPFWTAFAMILTSMVGGSILALPLALAGIGPLPSLVLLIVLGLVNLLTMTGMVEALIRHGKMRYGQSFFGQLVNDYLGRAGFLILTITLLGTPLLLVAFYTAVATTLAAATGVPAPIWGGLLFCGGLYLLYQRSLDATIAFALVVGAVNLSIILGLALLTLPHVRSEHLLFVNVPFVDGTPFDPAILQLIFGIVLVSFSGHIASVNVAKTVLRRDPSGRTFHQAAIAATVVAIVIYCLWVVVINGAIAPDVLANTKGTALVPLIPLLGPVVPILGSIYVVLSMGLGTVYFSLTVFNQVQEWLPMPDEAGSQGGWRALLHHPNGRFGLSILPIAVMVLFIEWLLWTGQDLFVGSYSFFGVVTSPILVGIFPVLMLVASRRKGEYIPSIVWHFLDHPTIVVGIYLSFLAVILSHGLWIWTNPYMRGMALLVALGLFLLTMVCLRRGALTPCTTIEVRKGGQQASFQIVSHGHLLVSQVLANKRSGPERWEAAQGEIENIKLVKSLRFDLPAPLTPTLKIWLHQVSAEGDSSTLPAQVALYYASEPAQVMMTTRDNQGQIKYSVPHAKRDALCQVEITFERI